MIWHPVVARGVDSFVAIGNQHIIVPRPLDTSSPRHPTASPATRNRPGGRRSNLTHPTDITFAPSRASGAVRARCGRTADPSPGPPPGRRARVRKRRSMSLTCFCTAAMWCRTEPTTSPTGNAPAWTRRSRPMNATLRSLSPGSAHNSSERPIRPKTSPPAGGSPRNCSRPYRRVQSRRSSGSARPWSGRPADPPGPVRLTTPRHAVPEPGRSCRTPRGDGDRTAGPPEQIRERERRATCADKQRPAQ
jgi:hypothetical protein